MSLPLKRDLSYYLKGFAPMPPAPLTLEAWWLRGVVVKRRSGLVRSMWRHILGPLGVHFGYLFGTLFSTLLGSLLGLLGLLWGSWGSFWVHFETVSEAALEGPKRARKGSKTARNSSKSSF